MTGAGRAAPRRTREQWLQRLAVLLRPAFKRAGLELPAKLRISCGWPSSRAIVASGKSRTIGQCWHPEASADGTTEVFISPAIGTADQAAAVLVHELVHAGGINGHAADFKRYATKLGLQGKMTETIAGEALTAELAELCAKIGPYPHATLDLTKNPTKKQGTRLLKLECASCGYTVRITQKWIDVGLPICPCGEELQPEGAAAAADEARERWRSYRAEMATAAKKRK